MEEAGAESLPFFPALAAYVLTLHDVQTKVVDCRRTAANNDIGSGMGIFGCDCYASVTPHLSSILDHFTFLLPPSTLDAQPRSRDPSTM